MRACRYRQFIVTDRDGHLVMAEPKLAAATPRWAAAVGQQRQALWPERTEPLFAEPIPFVQPPSPDSGEPFYSHNHCPAITWCPNGDLLAAWFSTEREQGTEMTILASRLRNGAEAWDTSAEFFKASDRNMTGTALYHDGAGTLFHFNGMGPAGVEGWRDLIVLLRTSRDNGVTWTAPRAISPDSRYQLRNQVIAGTSTTRDGWLLQPCDGTPTGEGPTALHVSDDGGENWRDAGGDIRGIHAGVVGLEDGRLLAFGRAQAIDGRMPISTSSDLGRSWAYTASPFPTISSVQRLVLMRLREGPLLLVSFTDAAHHVPRDQWQGMAFTDGDGRSFTGFGLFAALSFDEGGSWQVRRLLTPGRGDFEGVGPTGGFTASATQAEPKGYLAATQTPDGIIHLISSRLHYRFNLPWLTRGEATRG